MAEAAEIDEAVIDAEPAAEPVLLRSDAEGVVGLTLNRPNQYNALSRELLARLQAELDAIKDDPAVRVVVITGAGRAFCAGHDLKEIAGERERAKLVELFGACSRMMLSLTRLPQPVIALVDGIATARFGMRSGSGTRSLMSRRSPPPPRSSRTPPSKSRSCTPGMTSPTTV